MSFLFNLLFILKQSLKSKKTSNTEYNSVLEVLRF